MSLVGKPFSLQLGDFFLFTFFIAISSLSPPAEPGVLFVRAKENGSLTTAVQVLALPILPGRHQPSIVGRDELNYRVRNGNGWTLILISTNYCHPVSRINKQYKLVFAPCQYLLRFPCSELVTRTGFEPMLTA